METDEIVKAIKSIIDSTYDKQMVNVFFPNQYYMQYQLTQIRDNLKQLCNEIGKKQNVFQLKKPKQEEDFDDFDMLVQKIPHEDFKRYIQDENEKDGSVIRNNILEPENLLVMSIDIRNSTYLLENSKKPESYVYMINEINKKICSLVEGNYGMFDKFTGDGALVFFLESVSGSDYIKQGLLCGRNIEIEVQEILRKYEKDFHKFPYKTGIGVGIDIGKAIGKKFLNDATYLGQCVVNACRICDESFNNILIGTCGFNLIKEKYNDNLREIIEDDKSIECKYKNNIPVKVYEIRITDMEPNKPAWAISDCG